MKHWLKCKLGFHDYKVVIGTAQYQAVTRPSCKWCGVLHRLTQAEINRWWELNNQIQKLKKEQREL